MSKTRAELKAEAKALLHGRWRTGILLNLIPLLLSLVLVGIIFSSGMVYDDKSFLSRLFKIVSQLVITLASIGVTLTFVRWLRNPQQKIKPLQDSLFVFNSDWFLPVLTLVIIINLFVSLWTMLFIIPGIIKAFAYRQTYMVYQDVRLAGKQPISLLAMITRSRQLMYGHKMDYFLLVLSFLGWDLLGVLTLGIGFLWIAPYQNATYAAFYNDLVKTQVKQQPMM
ncbi:DUF975 family protein [Loigolactobacillus rennini]|uniref:Putative integral membrane protein n=1 Tax=Loigolactobacillus rennini DSM 20253 TaxID=1423796 RepID=A0A0R2D481_9LACO|nr:DUF975 family protein [Loigolactobacillus rennini]KRM95211.1 putative integral membrane protein [Loigolactobacillus rennini DSM 20253]